MNYHILGDPHLGKVFRRGVPLARRGEREAWVWDDFEIFFTNHHNVIVMGDIFDRFIVPPEVVIRAARIMSKNDVIVLRGNHDAARDSDRMSSFDLLAEICRDTNITLVVDEPYEQGNCAFVPWHPFKTAVEMVSMLPLKQYEVIYGHWDIDGRYNPFNPNLIPYDELKKRTDHVYTGHVHTPSTYDHDGMKVIVTGSMQPYSHSEDPTGRIYVTLTTDELEATDPASLRMKCVRIALKEGEDIPDLSSLDCLALSFKRAQPGEDEEEMDEEDIKVRIDEFDFDLVFKNTFADHGISDDVTQEILKEYRQLRSEA